MLFSLVTKFKDYRWWIKVEGAGVWRRATPIFAKFFKKS